MEIGSLAKLWEGCSVVRSRFRRSLPWLQWPLPGSPKPGKEPNDKGKDPHMPCTRAVELNAEVLGKTLQWCELKFLDINRLELEDFQSQSFSTVLIFFGHGRLYV